MKSTKTLVCLLTLLFADTITQAQTDPRYFNQTPPGTTPAVFAPGRISLPDQFEFGATYSRNGDEFYYGVEINGKAETRVMRFEHDQWTPAEKLLVHDVYSYNDPFLSPDERRLYFISDRPLSGEGPKKDYDIWYIQRVNGKWSEPINAGNNINSFGNEYYISFTKTGKMYFSSNGRSSNVKQNYDIYSSEFQEGKFQPALRADAGVNTEHYEADVYVAPDESFLVFAANRPEGLGSGDLYVSFRMANGSWGPSKSLGDKINTKTDDFCPFVSPDGKYLFYASRGDIYWVSSNVIKQLR
jgi:Tol biopolymer transport system component